MLHDVIYVRGIFVQSNVHHIPRRPEYVVFKIIYAIFEASLLLRFSKYGMANESEPGFRKSIFLSLIVTGISFSYCRFPRDLL